MRGVGGHCGAYSRSAGSIGSRPGSSMQVSAATVRRRFGVSWYRSLVCAITPGTCDGGAAFKTLDVVESSASAMPEQWIVLTAVPYGPCPGGSDT